MGFSQPQHGMDMVDSDNPKLPTCRLCGFQDHWLGDHLVEVHGISVQDYVKAHPQASTASDELAEELWNYEGVKERVPPPVPSDLYIQIADVRVKVNHDVPAEACLPLPVAFRLPTFGGLGEDVQDALISFALGRTTMIWGPPGSSKDALCHMWSALTRTPAEVFQVNPGEDIQAWMYSHEFNSEGTFWKEGRLLQLVRDGYLTPSGRRVPCMILITDFDRATKEQAEIMRLLLDSTQGRIKGPGGVTYPVLPGTHFVFTGNTPGGGDVRGRMISANVMDASIMDRIERVYEFHNMSWHDEELICKEKFPLLLEQCSKVFEQVGGATDKLRLAIANDEMYAEFSHRAVCSWLGAAEDIVSITGQVPPNLLKRSFRAYADKLPDQETRNQAISLIDPFLKGGALDPQSVSPKKGLEGF